MCQPGNKASNCADNKIYTWIIRNPIDVDSCEKYHQNSLQCCWLRLFIKSYYAAPDYLLYMLVIMHITLCHNLLYTLAKVLSVEFSL